MECELKKDTFNPGGGVMHLQPGMWGSLSQVAMRRCRAQPPPAAAG